MYVLRRYWNCLKHLEVFSVEEIKDATKISENQFWPRIEFLGSDDKPETYPTRDICPVQDPEVAAELDAQLDVLIAGSQQFLSFPFWTFAVVFNQFIFFYQVHV